jgi:hypothetical protein
MSFELGDRVRVKFPTGGVRPEDEFEVVDRPADGSDEYVWIKYVGPDMTGIRPFTYSRRPLGFYHESLEKCES